MFGSEILDVAIGLILMFLLVSLVLTAVQETVESFLKMRAGDLNQALYELLQRDEGSLRQLYDHPLIFALHRAKNGGQSAADVLESGSDGAKSNKAAGLWAAWRRRASRRELPSYIPRETFAVALLDLMHRDLLTHDRLITAYDTLDRLSGGDVARVRAELEGWYDGAMDRAAGWYKRRTQRMLFWLGLAAAVALNLNVVVVGRHLATDQDARALAVRYAENVVPPSEAPPSWSQLQELHSGLAKEAGLPVGWSEASLTKLRDGYPSVRWGLPRDAADARLSLHAVFAFLAVSFGYLATALAATLGAPFWFDVLNRIMVIRSTVKPKEKSPDEPSEDGGARSGSVGAGRTAAGGAIVGAVAVAPAPSPVNGWDDEELDGCVAQDAPDPALETRDDELPPATGGVAAA